MPPWYARIRQNDYAFYKAHFDDLSEAQQQTFVAMLKYTDPELFRWFMHQAPAPTQEMTDLIELIRSKIER
ncbi:Flavinator of succinate dehydrogenase [Actinobacillus equuli]|nr:Flavinator of succinate dehydrogenase [Actinobacillus equuli]